MMEWSRSKNKNNMKKHLLAIAITSAAALQANAASTIGYLSGNGGQEPWGVSSNVDAMNAAFGAGNWDRHEFGSFGAGNLAGLDFLYIDGGDGVSGQFNSFMAANIPTLEAWVSAGNRLFINAARWDGGEDYWGFGTYVYYPTYSLEGHAVGAHPIFDASTGTSWTGSAFGHDIVFDTSFATVIESEVSDALLVEGSWGLGHVMIGGMTSTFFHDPDVEAFNLRVNILDYMADGQMTPDENPVPEVQHYAAMLGAVLAGAEMLRRRRTA